METLTRPLKRDYLLTKPVKFLRLIDIKDQSEEMLLQEVINEKLIDEPDENPINALPRQTDNLNPEKERALQATLDAQRESRKKRLIRSEEAPSEPQVEPEPTPEPEKQPEEAPTAKKRGRKPKII